MPLDKQKGVRGSQYASGAFRNMLKAYGILRSMSRRGNGWKRQCLRGQGFVTRRQARNEAIAWLLRYNQARLHSTLAYVGSMQFESEWLASQASS